MLAAWEAHSVCPEVRISGGRFIVVSLCIAWVVHQWKWAEVRVLNFGILIIEFEKKSHHLLLPLLSLLQGSDNCLFLPFSVTDGRMGVSLFCIPTSGWMWTLNGKGVSLSTFVLPGGYKCMMNILTINVLPSGCLTQPVAVPVSYPWCLVNESCWFLCGDELNQQWCFRSCVFL